VDVLKKTGVGGHSTKGIFTCMKLLGINCDPTQSSKKENILLSAPNQSQWSEAYSIPVKFRIRLRWAVAAKK